MKLFSKRSLRLKKVLALTLIFVMSFGLLASGKTIQDNSDAPTWFIEKMHEFFGPQKSSYQFYDFQDNDVTEVFYYDNLVQYQNGNMNSIYLYFSQNIKTTSRTTLSNLYSFRSNPTIQVVSDLTQQVISPDGIYGLYLSWTMKASYVRDELEGGGVVSATKPTLSNFQFYDYYPTFMLPQLVGYTTTSSIEYGSAKFGMTINTAFMTVAGTNYKSMPPAQVTKYYR